MSNYKGVKLISVWTCNRCDKIMGYTDELTPNEKTIMICAQCVEITAKK